MTELKVTKHTIKTKTLVEALRIAAERTYGRSGSIHVSIDPDIRGGYSLLVMIYERTEATDHA